MRVTCDPEVDVFYIYIREDDAPAVDSVELDPGVSADVDSEGRVLGLEILNASEMNGQEENVTLSFELLGVHSVSSARHL